MIDRSASQGTFSFVGAGPFPNRPITVWFSRPEGSLADAPVLIVIPGSGRNAEGYRDDWLAHAATRGAILLVPELPDDEYSVALYNLANLVDGSGDPVASRRWTFTIVEALFDQARQEFATRAEGYYLYGHSAGAQFVHRFMLYMSSARVIRAVAANAGWYTVADPDIDFPYGLDNGPSLDEKQALAAPLTVLLGGEDDDPDADNLRNTAAADRQGATRLERGQHFFDAGRRLAKDLDAPFGWGLAIVPNASHSNAEMAPAAATALFG
jgi:poly(3-hydroxybutyrate) depolymerase